MSVKLILCSIDMCKSTKIKHVIEGKPIEYRDKLYRKLVNQMAKQEMDFYAQFNRSFNDICQENILSRIFVIKNIGDEFWFSIPLNESEQYSVSNIIYSLYSAFKSIREHEIIIDEQELSIEEEMDWESDRDFLRLPLNYKIYVDLVDSCVDFSETRTKTFFENYSSIFFPDDKLTRKHKEEKCEEIFNNWNMGIRLDSSFELKKFKYVNRTDLFGYQIDHFFRFTKEAKHKIFAIGNRAFDELSLYIGEHGRAEPHIGIQCGVSGAVKTKYLINFKKECEAKDIDLPYLVHYFTEDYCLRDIKHRYVEQKNSDYREPYELMESLKGYEYV